MSATQDAVLAFVREQHARTMEPVNERQIKLSGRVPGRAVISAVAALVRKGLLAVPQVGTAAWVPVEKPLGGGVDLSMTSDRLGVTEGGKDVPVGTKVEYLCHVSGGMVRVRLPDGTDDVMHPHCFAQLR